MDDREASDIRQALSGLDRSVGKIQGLLESHIATVQQHFELNERRFFATDTTLEAKERRLRKIETSQAKYTGLSITAATVISWLSIHFWPWSSH